MFSDVCIFPEREPNHWMLFKFENITFKKRKEAFVSKQRFMIRLDVRYELNSTHWFFNVLLVCLSERSCLYDGCIFNYCVKLN